MIIVAKGYKYEVDNYGIITQLDARPYPYDENYAAIYDGEKYRADNEKLMRYRVGWMLGAHRRPVKSMLDVGYGNGAFLNQIALDAPKIHRMGYDVTGVPLDHSHKMPDLKNADVTTFWDVIEHIPKPNILRELRTETICISVPYCHFHDLGPDWFENHYHHLKPNEHLRHFNPWSLVAFMNNLGWQLSAESDHEDYVRIRPELNGLQNIIAMAFKRR